MANFVTIPTAPVSQVFNNYNPGLYGGDGKHKGIDYAIAVGTPVFACLPGVVVVALENASGYGRHVRIKHFGGSHSIYGHLSELKVKLDDEVQAGQLIGLSGGDPKDNIPGDGLSTGAHLHWEIRPAGKTGTDQGAVDPMEYCLAVESRALRVAEVNAVNGLYVRPGAAAAGSPLYTLKRKQVVRVIETKDGWARLNSLRPEWCSMSYLWFTGETIPQVPEPEQVVISDAEKLIRLWNLHFPEVPGPTLTGV